MESELEMQIKYIKKTSSQYIGNADFGKEISEKNSLLETYIKGFVNGGVPESVFKDTVRDIYEYFLVLDIKNEVN